MPSLKFLVTLLPLLPLSLTSAENDIREKVPLDVHIMSKCPDARSCMELLISPAMGKIKSIVDFRLDFIGQETADDGISCRHGPSECLGNVVHLCAEHHYPTATSFPFSMCLLHEYQNIPDEKFIKSCAEETGVEFNKVNECASDIGPEGGMELLKESVRRSKEAGATISCTVRVGGRKWCVRDGGEWKDCEDGYEVRDLVRAVKALHEGKALRFVMQNESK